MITSIKTCALALFGVLLLACGGIDGHVADPGESLEEVCFIANVPFTGSCTAMYVDPISLESNDELMACFKPLSDGTSVDSEYACDLDAGDDYEVYTRVVKAWAIDPTPYVRVDFVRDAGEAAENAQEAAENAQEAAENAQEAIENLPDAELCNLESLKSKCLDWTTKLGDGYQSVVADTANLKASNLDSLKSNKSALKVDAKDAADDEDDLRGCAAVHDDDSEALEIADDLREARVAAQSAIDNAEDAINTYEINLNSKPEGSYIVHVDPITLQIDECEPVAAMAYLDGAGWVGAVSSLYFTVEVSGNSITYDEAGNSICAVAPGEASYVIKWNETTTEPRLVTVVE